MHKALDNPIWNAMISGNSQLSYGLAEVKLFPEDMSPFVGLKHFKDDLFKQLYELLPDTRTVAVFNAGKIDIPSCFTVVGEPLVLQMIWSGGELPAADDDEIVSLGVTEIEEMIALTRLTNPGPFLKRTIEFGNYEGIFKYGKLASMAGWRMQVNQFVEISAVCTHPDHVGKGYSRRLLNNQIRKILNQSKIPILHVMASNDVAIALYKKLGFVTRTSINIYILKKSSRLS